MNISNNRGITLVILTITIILLLIMATVSLDIGSDNISDSKEKVLKTEANIIKNAVLKQYSKYKTTKDESYMLGTKVNDSEISNIIGRTYESNLNEEKFYELSKHDLEIMNVKNVDDTYIVNYSGDIIIRYTEKSETKYYFEVNESSGIPK